MGIKNILKVSPKIPVFFEQRKSILYSNLNISTKMLYTIGKIILFLK